METARWKRFPPLYLQVLALLCGVGGQANPLDFLLLFGDDVHGHEHVERVVNTPPYVLLVINVLGEKRRKRKLPNYHKVPILNQFCRRLALEKTATLTESLGDMWLSEELNSATSSSATSL